MKYYHTQEQREIELEEPILCTKDNAWLGEAYYFWEEENDAVYWGETFKCGKTGKYVIYCATIDNNNILDTVFCREHYEFWLKQIEKAIKFFLKKTGILPTLKEVNDFFYERNMWEKVDGILFQDISGNPIHHMRMKEFQFKKRIQLALYKKEKITNFAVHYCK